MRYVAFDNPSVEGPRDYQGIAMAAMHSTVATEVTEEEYLYMLQILPPIYQGGGWMVMEVTCGSPIGPVHAMYQQVGDRFYAKWAVRNRSHTFICRVSDALPIDQEHARIAKEQYASMCG